MHLSEIIKNHFKRKAIDENEHAKSEHNIESRDVIE